jgi:hypothetical protein
MSLHRQSFAPCKFEIQVLLESISLRCFVVILYSDQPSEVIIIVMNVAVLGSRACKTLELRLVTA